MKILIFLSSYLFIFLTFFSSYANGQNGDFSVNEVSSHLYVPWDIEFIDEKTMLVSERNGRIVKITNINSRWNKESYYQIKDAREESEAGLMGMALHPDFNSNHYFYVMYAYNSQGLKAKIVRLIYNSNTAQFDRIILDNLPCAAFHCGGRIAFGPDGKLYASIGDARNPSQAQNTSSLAGKILRINDDGSVPTDNPFAGSYVYSFGHRNVQGLTWHPETNVFFASEHGPSGIDGFGGGDEINVIEPGGNYGWPDVSHRENEEPFIAPAWLFSPDGPPAVAPASAHIVQNRSHPWYGNLLISGLYEGDMIRCEINNTEVTSCDNVGLSVGRIREITESPEGIIYFSTSNRDGRETVNGKILHDGDDKIYQLIVSGEGTEELVMTNNDQPGMTTKSEPFYKRILDALLSPFYFLATVLRK